MADENRNLWAPWRMEYIRSLAPDAETQGCFLCRYWQQPDKDAEHHVVFRRQHVLVVMNRFPYTNGHLMIAPCAHEGDVTRLDEAVLQEMTRATRDAVRLLDATIAPQGYNVGLNLGRCAGAGLPDHLHTHVVPRWNGDTNYMAVLGDVRVIPDSLDKLHGELTACWLRLGLTD